MDIISQLKCKIDQPLKKIVFPEGEDSTILNTAVRVMKENVAIPVLLGTAQKISDTASSLGLDISGIEMEDPAVSEKLDQFSEEYCRDGDFPIMAAKRMLSKKLAYGAMLVRTGNADAMIGGIAHATEEVITTSRLIIGLKPGISVPSSYMIMDIPGYKGEEGSLLAFADASVNPDPDPQELADIAVSTAESVKALLGWEPRVAMLSFSTCGSAEHPHVEKVQKALEIAREKAPGLKIDGEFQVDTAIVKDVAARKVKRYSEVAGRANTLVFPDLDSGNMGYKLVQRLANANGYGMMLQGFAKPVCDLSRGATVEDVFGLTVMTVVQLYTL